MLVLIIATLALYLPALLWVQASSVTRQGRRAPAAAIDAVDALLPQTQCGDCGYPGCRPYARAIVAQDAPLNLCPPGGDTTVHKLELLLGKAAQHAPPAPLSRAVARIDEETCIGCVKCIVACPVDAIVGSARQLHAVMPEYCTGCKLCLPPCPVDCISMEPAAPAGAPELQRRPYAETRPHA